MLSVPYYVCSLALSSIIICNGIIVYSSKGKKQMQASLALVLLFGGEKNFPDSFCFLIFFVMYFEKIMHRNILILLTVIIIIMILVLME